MDAFGHHLVCLLLIPVTLRLFPAVPQQHFETPPLANSCPHSTPLPERERSIAIIAASHDGPLTDCMFTMDFFKNCSTNVYQIDNILETQYLVFVRQQVVGNRRIVHDDLAKLRAVGVLCASAGHELWVFFPTGRSENLRSMAISLLSTTEYSLESGQSISLAAEPTRTATDGRTVQDVLFGAIEKALSFKFATDSDLVRIGPWTWLFRSALDQPDLMLRLYLSISGTGTLHATAATMSCIVPPVDSKNALAHTGVLLAPGGRMADLVFHDQSSLVGVEYWKHTVTSMLRESGISLNPDNEWLLVRTRNESASRPMFWPSRLVLSPIATRQVPGPGYEREWKHWFMSSDEAEAYQSPLAEVETLFTESAARARVDADSARAEALAKTVNNDAQSVATYTDTDSVLATSPPFVQRIADHQAAMLGIYPTPPDGLAPGHASQQHGSDNTTALALVDPSSTSNELLVSSDIQHDVDQSLDSLHGPSASFPLITDDLFGDMGEMDDFAGDEIGDADFSFFDEPDGTPPAELGADLDLPEALEDDGMHIQPDRLATADQVSHASMSDSISNQPPIVADSRSVGTELLSEGKAAGNNDDIALVEAVMPLPETEKPLSPFGIRERLLPPPVPASAKQNSAIHSPKLRRSSTFDPVVFRDGLDLDSKYLYRNGFLEGTEVVGTATGGPNISLPERHGTSRCRRPCDILSAASEQSSESEDDSHKSGTSMSDADVPPNLPWNIRKRKRTVDPDLEPASNKPLDLMWSDEDGDERKGEQQIADEIESLVDSLLANVRGEATNCIDLSSNLQGNEYLDSMGDTMSYRDTLISPLELLDPGKVDMVCIAQLVGEQAISCLPVLLEKVDVVHENSMLEMSCTSMAVRRLAEAILSGILPSIDLCEVASLALVKERAIPIPHPRPGQPRASQRVDPTNLGPEFFTLPPPFVCIRRGQETYQMLPPALDFWEPLSLGPPHGPKHVKAFCVLPANDALRDCVVSFLDDLGSAYESCRLGRHHRGLKTQNNTGSDWLESGLALVHCDQLASPEAVFRAYSLVCFELGVWLNSIGHLDPERTIMVYMVDLFPGTKASQYLCACFWKLYKAYRDNVPKPNRGEARCDIVLQVLPVTLMASPHELTVLDSKQITMLAKEVYARCPPSSESYEGGFTSSAQTPYAPFFELAHLPPRKIQFQLISEPPSDLLHEGSVLHVAYAMSGDGQWMTAYWINSTGSYQRSSAFSLRGRTFSEVAEEVWEQTREAMISREIMWRVFVISTDEEMDDSMQKCWRRVVAERPRKQVLSVTLLSAQMTLPLKLTPPTLADDASTNAPGFPTPATTPSGSAFVASPDSNPHTNAPPTPAPSDSILAETDPDAHLIDLADETWGMLFAAPYTHPGALISGALFKRGSSSGTPLAAFGVSALCTLHVRPSGQVDEGNVKHAEMMLKDVLRMYRGLGVLTRARGLVAKGDEGHDDGHGVGGNGQSRVSAVPIHLVAARRSAQALSGLLGPS